MIDYRKLTVETYNKSAKELAEYFRGVGSRNDDIDKAFELAGNPHEPKVVEIGCGDGRDAKEIYARTPNYVGFDISEELIKLAQVHVPGAKFEVADAASYTFPPETDIIFAFASLLHLNQNEVKKVMRNAFFSLKPRGIIYISLKQAPGYESRIKKDHYGTRRFYFYNPEIIEQLAGHGYKTVYTNTEVIGSTDWFEIALQRQ